MPDVGFEESGELVPAEHFDYDAVDRAVFGSAPDTSLKNLSQAEINAACEVFEKLLEWIWQNGMKNPEGLQIRSIIVCWIFLKHLRPLSLTEMATGFGKKKQSLGRWVDEFKIAFANIRTPHMRSLDKRAAPKPSKTKAHAPHKARK